MDGQNLDVSIPKIVLGLALRDVGLTSVNLGPGANDWAQELGFWARASRYRAWPFWTQTKVPMTWARE